MKVIIAGSREIDDYNTVKLYIEKAVKEHKIKITEVVSGGAAGVDLCGEEWAKNNDISIKKFIPNWKDINVPGAIVKQNAYGSYNAKAGITRNEDMGKYADAVIVIWDGISKGSQHMGEFMAKLKKPVYSYLVGPDEPDTQEENNEDNIPF